jgi:hypothetical protein
MIEMLATLLIVIAAPKGEMRSEKEWGFIPFARFRNFRLRVADTCPRL